MAHEHFTQEIDESLKFRRPTLHATGVFVGSVGLGAISFGLDTTYRAVSGVRKYSREHGLRERLVGGLKSLGDQALSALGEFSGPNDGVCLTDSSTSMGYVVVQEVIVPPQTQQDTGEVV